MSIITDDFVAPILDSTKWADYLFGAGTITVGVPADGVYPENITNVADLGGAESKNRIYVPANHNFSYSIKYNDVYTDVVPPVNRSISLGWRSMLEFAGVPLWGVDVFLYVFAGPSYLFVERTITNGVLAVAAIIPDPTAGADGRLRIEREGLQYKIDYYNGGWVNLDSILLGYTGVGLAHFFVLGG